MTPEGQEFSIEPPVSKGELQKRRASIEKMMASELYSGGAKRALEENLKDIDRQLTELEQEE